MERLYKITSRLLLGTLLLGTPALAQDYCALKVRVLTPKGKQIPVHIAVTEKSGRVTEKEQPPDQDTLFCDLGILPVKVVVGLQGCNHVTVEDLALYWMEPYTLAVIHDPEHCMNEAPPPPQPVCRVLFRIIDSEGAWVSKANLTFDNSALAPLQTDRAGRALLITGLSARITGRVNAPGHPATTFLATCSAAGSYEKLIALGKAMAKPKGTSGR